MDRRQFLSGAAGVAPTVMQGRSGSGIAALVDEVIGPEFSGSVTVALRGRTAIRKGYGVAERSFGAPCAPGTAYRIASITKLLTSTVIMQLVDAGRIDLDAPIDAYLRDYAGPAADKVKIRQLLNHTSGIENFDKGLVSYADAAMRGMPAYQLPRAPRELMNRFASGPLVHTPGTTFDYNNADYVILGQVIEAVDKAPYETVLARRILAPLAMSATGLAASSKIVPSLAPTYYKDGDGPLANDMPVYAQNWYAAGGLYSTCDDLLKFSDALYGGRLMSARSLQALLTPGLDEYGFGQWVSTLDVGGQKHRFAQRPGRIMGANTLLLRMLDDDLTIVVLGNTNLVDTDRVGFTLAKRLLGAAKSLAG